MKLLRRYLVPLVILLVVAGLVGWLLVSLLSTPSTATSTTFTVGRRNLSATVRTTGKVEPARQVNLTFRTTGLVKQIYVKPGDIVPAGTLLAELDDSQLLRDYSRAQSQVDINQFNQSGANERFSKAPTPTAAPNPTPTPVSSLSDLYVGAVQSELAATQVAVARNALENARLYAPFEGSVLTVNINEGEVVNGIALVFADLRQFQVRAEIDEIDVANVEIGQKVNVTLDAFPGRSFEGQVISLAPAPSSRQGNTTFASIVRFSQNPTVAVRPGMAASLTITSNTKTNVLTVPNRAIETVGLRRFVSLLKPDGTIEKIAVEVGLTNGTDTEIVSGLKEGDKLTVGR